MLNVSWQRRRHLLSYAVSALKENVNGRFVCPWIAKDGIEAQVKWRSSLDPTQDCAASNADYGNFHQRKLRSLRASALLLVQYLHP